MTAKSETLTSTYSQALQESWNIIRRTIPKMGTDRPSIGLPDLTYKRCGDHDWVDGFWAGQLWLAYTETKDPVFFEAARAQHPYFIERLERPESHSHDLGFLYTHSLVAEYKWTGDTVAREGALRAAEALARRYNENGRFILAWNSSPEMNNDGRIIIDCMENLALLFWAAQESGSRRYYDIATAHAQTTARYIVRADSSSYHTYFFNPTTGEPLRGETHQGFADESCWSRGQAWGLHGFTLTAQYTGDPAMLEVACKLADYIIDHLPDDYVPFWDYRLPADAPQYRDTSAAAISAAGLFFLANQVSDPAASARYTDTANKILLSLAQNYTTKESPQAEGLLVQGSSHVLKGLYNSLLPYGDYFYVESLLRALGRTNFAW